VVKNRTLGVLGGADFPPDMLKVWAVSADILIAADSGADRLLDVDVTPNAIVGDMDSLSERGRKCGAELYLDLDQSYTDCDKLLAFASAHGHVPLALAGAEGDRIDHLLATCHSIAKSAISEQVTIILRCGLGFVLHPGLWRHRCSRGRTVSLLPLTPCIGVATKGLQWALKNEDLEMGRRISISNLTTETDMEVSHQAGVMLVVVQCLAEEFPRW
jgi:thiamine pyrophosphokinase